jgi:hypothetical protein
MKNGTRPCFALAAFLAAGTAMAGERSEPLPITIRAPEPPSQKDRLEQLLAKREEAARRWRIGICRGCARDEIAAPAGRMIEVSTDRPRASWETVVPP